MTKKMTKRQAHRLLNVARALDESPLPEAFDMKRYVHVHDEAKAFEILDLDNAFNKAFDHDDEAKMQQLENQAADFCGTPACALGHYGSRRDLQKLMRVVRGRKRNVGLFYKNNNREIRSDTLRPSLG